MEKYCKDWLFWVLWACLIMATKHDGICFKEALIFFFMQKIKFMSYLFLANILQPFVTLGTLYMPGQPHQNDSIFLQGILVSIYNSFLRYYTLMNCKYD